MLVGVLFGCFVYCCWLGFASVFVCDLDFVCLNWCFVVCLLWFVGRLFLLLVVACDNLFVGCCVWVLTCVFLCCFIVVVCRLLVCL